MRDRLKLYGKHLVVLGGLLLLIGFSSINYVQAADLTLEVKNKLIYIREEEKLARDVYLFLNNIWGSRIFKNISDSEQTHMNQIKTLLDRYGVLDPAAGYGAGVFNNSEIQALYNNLIQQGSQSLVSAFQVGVLIEQMDIEDLDEGISLTVRNDIKTILGNLRSASFNHLGAFQSKLE
jgi:hypothetical protein